MNSESTPGRHGGRGTHDGSGMSYKLKQSLPNGLCLDHHSPRGRLDRPKYTPAEHGLENSRYGRRRTESAPDALLDCLHCGKDLIHTREERSAHRPKKRHSRRYTVASETVWSPTKSTSSVRIHAAQPQRREERNICECCERSCLEGTRKNGRCAGVRRQRSRENKACHCCGDQPTCDCVRRNIGHASRKNSREKKCISKLDDRTWVRSTDPCRQTCTVDDSSGDDCTEGSAFSYQDHHRSTASCRKPLKCKGDINDYATCDDEDSELGLINLNENRRRKSTTSLSRKSNRERGRIARRNSSISKRRSSSRDVSHKQTCRVCFDQHAEPQKDVAKISHNSHNLLKSDTALKCKHRPPASEDDENNDEETETVDTKSSGIAHSDSLLIANLSDMLRHHRLCDVTLRANGQEGVSAHKLALAAFSDTFARTYCEGDSGDVVIDVPDTTVGGLQEVLRFVYSGDIRLTPDNVGSVLAAASFLHIDHIVHSCKQMIVNPDIETVIPFSSLAEKYHLCEDLTYFYDFLCKHFLCVSRTRGWKTLNFPQVFDLLSENNLHVERELDVFLAAVAWIDADRVSRLPFAADLIGCVRFAYVTPDEIAKHVESKQFLFHGDEGKELLLCIYRHHALQTCGCQHGHQGHHLPRRQYVALEAMPAQDHSTPAYSPRRRLVLPSSSRQVPRPLTQAWPPCDVILAVGGVNPFQPDVDEQARLAAEFHPRQNHWTTLTHLPDGRHHHGAVLLGGYLYIIGGSILDDMNPEQLCNPTASCYRYDLTKKQWSAIAPLNVPRMYHATAVLNEVIFVMAGQTQQSRHLSSMECYRPEVGEWETGVAMAEGRIGVAVAAYRGLLYAVGGFLETEHEHVVRATVEVFDPRTYSWSCLSGLPSPRCHAGLVECGGKLYLVGGSTFPANTASVCSLPSVLRYDENDDRWVRIQTLRTPRHDMAVAVLGSRIFVVGGVSSVENKVLRDVECYDVEADYWLDDVEPIGSPALGLTCLTVLADQ